MNNKMFIAVHNGDKAELDAMRMRLESEDVFDRYGDARVAEKAKRFGFETVVPGRGASKFRCLKSLLGCSYVYLPCGWRNDKCGRRAFTVAELLGKKMVFEEDGRCR